MYKRSTLVRAGDPEGILRHISPSVAWECGAQRTEIPWLHQGSGHEAVKAFFASL
ncbi:MAG: hypothetical protein M3Q06_00295 [Bacteroidota bacterium]|nr:hypothetical protein [Bacteroidota bacterium]